MKKHQREKLEQDGKWNQQMKCGPQSSMNLLDDYHSGEHPCHLTSTVAPESPQPPGALGWVGQAYAKRKSVRLQEVPPNMMKVKVESEKVGLQLNIQKTKIMASGPITSWQIDGETVETVADFIFLGSKITADGDCSHEIKRHLLLPRSKCLKFMATITICSDFGAPKDKVSHCFHCFPIYFP